MEPTRYDCDLQRLRIQALPCGALRTDFPSSWCGGCLEALLADARRTSRELADLRAATALDPCLCPACGEEPGDFCDSCSVEYSRWLSEVEHAARWDDRCEEFAAGWMGEGDQDHHYN